jgi:hypothetical protein
MPWEKFIQTRIFDPLGMKESIPLVAGIAGQPNVSKPHDVVKDTVRLVKLRTTDAIASAGSVWSSVSDMSKWMRFMLDSGRVRNRRLIQPATFREIVAPQMRAPRAQYPVLSLTQPHFFSYALGRFVQDFHGETVWMHTGSIDGQSAIIGLLPERRVGVYVLANLDHAELRHALMYQVFDMYRSAPKAPSRDWNKAVKALFDSLHAAARAGAPRADSARASTASREPSLPLERYAGSYVDSTYGTIDVTLAGGALHARFENFDVGELKHVAFDSFRSAKEDPLEGSTELTFVPDGAGHVSAVQAFGVTFNRTEGARKLRPIEH